MTAVATLDFTKTYNDTTSIFSLGGKAPSFDLSLVRPDPSKDEEAKMPMPGEDKQEAVVEYVNNEIPFQDAFVQLRTRLGTWKPTFDRSKLELKQIAEALENDVRRVGYPVPDKNDLFRAFELTPLDKVRVVIIGQDPYPQILNTGKPRAKGLSFSVDPTDDIPSSLKNIYKEIKQEYPEWEIPNHGDLTDWAKQGVLMLNVCLTCRPGQPGYHSKYKLWMPFILRALRSIEEVRPNCIYVMWGSEAQKMSQYIGEKSIQLTSPHPSGLSAYRGFIGNGHFKEINSYLTEAGEEPIKW